MKVVRKFKRTIGRFLFACMVFNSMAPAMLAVERSMMMTQQMEPDYLNAQEGGIDQLVMEIVNKAASMDMDAMPSAALMRCYERMVGGYTTMLVSDVMEAMPELLGYALMRYESNATRSGKAARPQSPYAPGAAVGPILVDGSACNTCDQGCPADLCSIIKLLLLIKKQIGTVADPVTANSVLGVLGDANTILDGENISQVLKEILDTINTGSSFCCDQILESLAVQTALIQHNFETTWSLITDINTSNSQILSGVDLLNCKFNNFGCIPLIQTRAQECEEIPKGTELLAAFNAIYCKQQEDTAYLADLITSISCSGSITSTCCASIEAQLADLQCLIECKLGNFNDCDDCDDCDDCFDCNDNCIRSVNCDDCDFDCNDCGNCPTFDNVSDGLSEIFCNVTECCALTQSNFEFTWSLIERICTNSNGFCCDEILNTLSVDFAHTWSLIENLENIVVECCEETHSLLLVLLDTVTQCCDDLADDIFDAQSILCCKLNDLKETLTECCDDLADDIYDTQTIIIECCEITQSNFEFTWSLIEACCLQTQSNFEFTWSLIEECCEQTQSNFEHTWSLIENLEEIVIECCEQTQSNFEFTWSLLKNLEITVSVDFTVVLTTLIECCEQTQSNFEFTWSLIEACCEQTQSNFEHTWSLIEACCEATQSAIEVCCEQTQSNFEHTWSLIEACCEATQSAIEVCCEQTQSNFEHTWSLIENLEEIVVKCCESTQSAIDLCCEQTQSNFEHTWSLIENLEEIVVRCCEGTQSAIDLCCEQTQSNFEHTWSLIENLEEVVVKCCESTQSAIDVCCEQTQSNFEHTWSLIENLEEVVVKCCEGTQSAIDLCCEQTQSNFEHTWSLIENLEEIVVRCCEGTQSAIDLCCEQTQSNFEHTWSLIENLEEVVVRCCEQTQSNFEFTWSLIEHLATVTFDFTEILTTLIACCEETQSNFEHTWSLIENLEEIVVKCCEETDSKLDDLLDCCHDNCSKLACIEEILLDTCDVEITINGPVTITEAGTYCLVNNVSGSSESPLIRINTSGVTLNLNGFTVENTSGDAIMLSNVSDIVIKNGLVTSSVGAGINIPTAAANVQVVDVTFQACSIGLNAENTVGLTVDSSIFYNGNRAVRFESVQNGLIRNSQIVKNNGVATDVSTVAVGSSSNVTIESSVIAYNTVLGNANAVHVSNGSTDFNLINTEVNDNSSSTGVFAGVKIEGTGHTIRNCTFNFNGSFTSNAYGLWVAGALSAFVENSSAIANYTLAGSDGAGFYFDECANCTLNGSTATNHTGTAANKGIKVNASSNCSVTSNTVLDNAIGIDVTLSSLGIFKNYADNNTLNYNGAMPTVIYNKGAGTFAGIPTAWDNIDAQP